ncbi:hypothetical protein AB0F93_03580 [Micromonospora tulbaghiae]|uniref:hypothetical protein n=1 Tax=Micromonospora tulbaghiae TaxID=479978 RepID=UPI00332E4405
MFRPGPGPARTTGTGTKGRPRLTQRIADGGYISALTIVVAIVASLGQKMFAVQEKFTGLIVVPGSDVDITPWLAVAAFDLATAALLHGGIRAARMNQSPWPWWIGAAIIGGLSIYTNTQHTGAWITASASIALLIIWFLRMYGEYAELTRTRRANAAPKLLTSTLLIVDRQLAYRAWVISTTKPLPAAVEFRRNLGEKLTERDVAVLAARLYRDVHADTLYTEMNPHLRTDENGEPAGKRVRFWQRDRIARANLIADMTAGDAVDAYLGLPVINRQGIRPGRVTYAAPEPTPRMGVVPRDEQPARDPEPAPQPDDPKPQPENPAAGTAPDPAPEDTTNGADDPDEKPKEQPGNAPVSPAGCNLATYRTLAQIVELADPASDPLPFIDPTIDCGCNRKKPCGRKLVDHVQRKGEYVVSIMNTFGDWGTRVERIGKAHVAAATDKSGSSITNEMAGLFDHLRKLAHEQRAHAA